MALAINDVIEVSFRGTLFGQRILNILHYAVTVVNAMPTLDQLQLIADELNTGAISAPLIPTWMDAVAPQYNLDEIRVQRVYPTRTIYQRSLPDTPGVYAGTCLTANIAVSIQKRGVTSGRQGNGRMQLAGIPREGMDGGSIDVGGYGPLLSAFRNQLLQNESTSGGEVTLQPCIFNPTGPAPHYQFIASWLVQTTLRTMHRRTLLVGE